MEAPKDDTDGGAAARDAALVKAMGAAHKRLLPGNDDLHVKMSLQGLHPRIHVVRHPPPSIGKLVAGKIEDVIWSHHEKILAVDRRVAFVGGIDLAFGRYDWHQHAVHAAAPPGHCRAPSASMYLVRSKKTQQQRS